MIKMILILEDDWSKDLQEIKDKTGVTKQFQVRQAVQDWINKNKIKEAKK